MTPVMLQTSNSGGRLLECQKAVRPAPISRCVRHTPPGAGQLALPEQATTSPPGLSEARLPCYVTSPAPPRPQPPANRTAGDAGHSPSFRQPEHRWRTRRFRLTATRTAFTEVLDAPVTTGSRREWTDASTMHLRLPGVSSSSRRAAAAAKPALLEYQEQNDATTQSFERSWQPLLFWAILAATGRLGKPGRGGGTDRINWKRKWQPARSHRARCSTAPEYGRTHHCSPTVNEPTHSVPWQGHPSWAGW